MPEKAQISNLQLTTLVITIILSSAVLLLPAFPTREALQDSWMSAILAMGMGLLAAVIILSLGTRFSGQSLIEYSGEIMGKPLGKFIGFLYLLFYLHLTAILAREVGATIVTSILPRTPPEVLMVITVIATAFLIRKGIEVIARVNMIILPISVFLVVATYILASTVMKVDNLTPVMENGVLPILKGAVTPTGWFGEVVSLGFLLPYVNRLPGASKAAFTGIFITGAVFTMVVAGTVAIFGPEVTRNLTFPTLSSVQQVSIGNFIERIESLLVAAWIVWNFIKTAIFYYITVTIISRLLNLKDYRPLVFPVGILIGILGLALFSSSVQLGEFLALVWGKYAGIFEFIIPLLLLTVALLRGKKGAAANAK